MVARVAVAYLSASRGIEVTTTRVWQRHAGPSALLAVVGSKSTQSDCETNGTKRSESQPGRFGIDLLGGTLGTKDAIAMRCGWKRRGVATPLSASKERAERVR